MALTLTNLSVSFGEKSVIHNLSYSFPEHGCELITGESGSGKTTLLRLIAGLAKPDEGKISGGKNVSFAFQEYRLFPSLSAAENVAVAVSLQKKDLSFAVEMLMQLGFTKEETALYPDALSGGMKQRVSLARAFLKSAPVLLLDEPFKELDPALAEKVAEIIRAQAEWRLVLLSAHSDAAASALGARILPIAPA